MSQSQPPATPSRPLDAVERAARNGRIAQARAAGEPWAPIAEREGISIKQARRGMQRHLSAPVVRAAAPARRLADVETEALITRIIAAQEQALGAALALMATGENGSVKIGAARTALTAGSMLLSTLQRVGLVGDPGMVRFMLQTQEIARFVNLLIERHGLPDEVVGEAWAEVRPRALTWEAAA